jgi:hypothetical protein
LYNSALFEIFISENQALFEIISEDFSTLVKNKTLNFIEHFLKVIFINFSLTRYPPTIQPLLACRYK